VARGAARVRARRLHASDARAVVGCELHFKGPAVAGRRLTRGRTFRSNIVGIWSTIRTRGSRVRSWSIPTRVIFITSCRTAKRSVTAWRWGRRRWPGPASLRLAGWLNGLTGSRRRRFRRASALTHHAFREGRLIPWARGRSTFTRATRTPCIAYTAPTSRNILAKPYRPAASA